MPATGTIAAKTPAFRASDTSENLRAKQRIVLSLILVLVTLAVYNPVAHNGFTNLDDDLYIVNNPHVRAGLNWSTIEWAFTSREAANWHPLTWLSHALDCQIFKLNPLGPHYVNLLFHVANAVLVFLLLQSATGLIWPSVMVAALFALHPINVESVAWASERKNVLSLFFFLLTLFAYNRYVRKTTVRRYALVAVLFALGLMAKPEIITLPFVLLLWDFWPLHRMRLYSSSANRADGIATQSFSHLFVEKLPLLALSAGSAVITIIAQRGGHAVRTASMRVRFGNAVVAYVRYLGKAFWPSRLTVLYPHPGRLLPNWQIFVSAVILLLLTAALLRLQRDYAIVGWFWFLGTLVPVIGFVQVGVQAMADRYAYLSFIGLFICVVWGVAEFARKKELGTAWLCAPAILILGVLGMLTRHQVGYWHDSETLWRHALSVTGRNYTAHDALAHALGEQGRIDEAIAEYNKAEELHAYSSAEMISIALFEESHGRTQAAISQLEQAANAAEDADSRSAALACLGSAFMQAGDLLRAKMSFISSLQQNHNNAVALVGSGLLAEREGDFGQAAKQIEQAMQIQPTDVGYLLLAQALQRAGQSTAAQDATQQAHRISRDFDNARKSADSVLAASGILSHDVAEGASKSSTAR